MAVFESIDMYLKDLGQNVIDLACDEAIFRRTKSYKNENLSCRFILGQWHTSKAMCNALIAAFSGYGIYSIVTKLGVRFLDKLEQNVDYRATCNVLELIWMAVGIAIYIHMNNKNITLDDVIDNNNIAIDGLYMIFIY